MKKVWRRIIQAVICISLGAFIAVKINELTLPSSNLNLKVDTSNNWYLVGFQVMMMVALIGIGIMYGRKQNG